MGGGALKWSLKGGSRLIEVTATAGLTVFTILRSNIYLVLCLLYLQVHKIIGFAPVLLQVVMEDTIDMPVRQAGKYIENEPWHEISNNVVF